MPPTLAKNGLLLNPKTNIYNIMGQQKQHSFHWYKIPIILTNKKGLVTLTRTPGNINEK